MVCCPRSCTSAETSVDTINGSSGAEDVFEGIMAFLNRRRASQDRFDARAHRQKAGDGKVIASDMDGRVGELREPSYDMVDEGF